MGIRWKWRQSSENEKMSSYSASWQFEFVTVLLNTLEVMATTSFSIVMYSTVIPTLQFVLINK